jgi:hypothetical protein
MWKAAVLAYFEVLIPQMSVFGAAEESNERTLEGWEI